jgi:hypothetical protein
MAASDWPNFAVGTYIAILTTVGVIFPAGLPFAFVGKARRFLRRMLLRSISKTANLLLNVSPRWGDRLHQFAINRFEDPAYGTPSAV